MNGKGKIPYGEKGWITEPHHVIVVFRFEGELIFEKTTWEFFDLVIRPARCELREALVFRSDGLYMRRYQRIFSYFKRDDSFKITSLSLEEIRKIWRGIGKPIRQQLEFREAA